MHYKKATPYRIQGNVYLIGGPELSHPYDCLIYLIDFGEIVIIDSGAGSSFEQLIDNILALNLDPKKITTVIATHAHIDHIGSLHLFQDNYNARIIAHEKDTAAIETGSGTGAQAYGVDYIPCTVDFKIQDAEYKLDIGDVGLNIVHIPGHTPGGIAVYLEVEGKRVLFGQDIHGPYYKEWGADKALARKSLQKLIDLNADILCEGHFGIYRPASAVKDYISGYLSDL